MNHFFFLLLSADLKSVNQLLTKGKQVRAENPSDRNEFKP